MTSSASEQILVKRDDLNDVTYDAVSRALARRSGAFRDDREPYRPQGNIAQIFEATEPEILVEGPAGTGKSRGVLQRWNQLAKEHKNAKGLILRKTLASLTASGLQTYERDVLPGELVRFYGGSYRTPPHYVYLTTGTRLYLGSLNTKDAIDAVMSTDYDWIYVQEATELQESELQALTTRLRFGRLPFQQLVADCNPGPPSHWLNQRANAGRMRRIITRHVDNPRYWDEAAGDWTEEGRRYVLGTLAGLTGVYRKRLYEGIWAAAEGMVYDAWDPAVHVVNEDQLRAWGLLL